MDDLPPFRNELLVEFVGSPLAHGRIVTLDVNKAAQLEGIAAVLTAADVPGDNNFGPIFHDEEVLAAYECHHIGQPIVVLAGESRAALRGPGGDQGGAGRAAGDPVDRPGDRRRPFYRPDPTSGVRRRRGHPGTGPACDRGNLSHRRARAFLPRDSGGPGHSWRGRPDDRAFLDPEPKRGPVRGGALSGHRPEHGRLRLHADGRWLRRQGVAGRPSCRHGGPGRPQDRPAGAHSFIRGTSTCG